MSFMIKINDGSKEMYSDIYFFWKQRKKDTFY